jgi:hypothetical protein
MTQPFNFRNSSNTITYATATANSSNLVTDAGVLEFAGKTMSDPCYLKNGRLLPYIVSDNTSSVIDVDIKVNNNFHINTSVAISSINFTNLITGQSGHILIKSTSALTHTTTWTANSNASYVKWHGNTVPTLSSTQDYIDIISYYVYDSNCILLIASTGYY